MVRKCPICLRLLVANNSLLGTHNLTIVATVAEGGFAI